jgi:hypothetical protein
MQKEVFLFATDIESLILRYNVVVGTFEFVVAFGCHSLDELFLEFCLSFPDFISNFHVLLLPLLQGLLTG